jgi:hypothetical protein
MEGSKGSRVLNTMFMILGVTTMLLTLYDRFCSKKKRNNRDGDSGKESIV